MTNKPHKLEFIIECLSCGLLNIKPNWWISPSCYPLYTQAKQENRITGGYCLTCGDHYLEIKGFPPEARKLILGDSHNGIRYE